MKIKISTFIALLFWSGFVVAQVPTPELKVLTRAYKDSIKIRWAPTTPTLWQQARKYGYRVEKFLVYQAGKVLPKAQPLPLQKSLFRPQPIAQWSPYLEKNAQVTIAYQAMYGEGSVISTTNRMLKVAQQAQEQDLRFALALMAADYSALVAQLSGLGFADKEVKKGEKYLYRVTVALPANLPTPKAGAAYAGTDDFAPLPKPVELEGQFGDKTVLLVWNQLYYQRTYGAYYVERSVDGKNYQRTTEQPYAIIQRNQTGALPTRYMTAVDSLPQNNKTYYFRVRGLTPFGEIGPPSDTVIKGQGVGKAHLDVTLQKPKVTQKAVQLVWRFDSKKQDKIKGFRVQKASKAKGKYQSLHSGLLPVNQRSLQDTASSGASYYKVTAIARKGEPVHSFPHLVQLPDSIPPDAPLKLEGKVDSNGVVTIRWQPPTATDIKGYHLYRSEGANDEFTRINVVMVGDTTYTDSISLRTLNPDIYYKVQAIDHYFNPSPLSPVLLLKRPDKTPPQSPAFVEAVSTDSSVNLSFQASASYDVAHHLLYRTKQGKDEWQLQADFSRLDTAALQQFKDTTLHQTYYRFIDKTPQKGQRYLYTLVAIDSAGLESPPSRPASGQKLNKGLYPAVKNIKVSKQPQIKLEWVYGQSNVKTFRIYRAVNDAPLRMYRTYTLSGNKNQAIFIDQDTKKGQWYTYRIQAIGNDQGISKFSKAIRIKY